MNLFFSKNKKNIIFIIILIIPILILIFIPTGFEKQIYFNSEGVVGKIISVDNTSMHNTGLIYQGEQRCIIEIETGSHKGEKVKGINLFMGKLEFDKVFKEGDKAWILLEFDNEGNLLLANMIDHYRINQELLLIGLFSVVMIIFSGFTGIRTLLSFSFTLLTIWKILIPLMLKGYNPLLVALIIGNIITICTLLLVAGFTKKAFAAIISSMACSLITCLLAIVFGRIFNIHGAVMQWSEALLYAGFVNLNLTDIFQAGIYLACSGAIMDLAIDISSALEEIKINSPNISKKVLIISGLNIGKSVVGSQTTTLLLAYMGSYISVMMVYMAQGTPIINIFTSKAIAGEILHTFVGCIGLVLVSPLTSLVCGIIYEKQYSFNQSI